MSEDDRLYLTFSINTTVADVEQRLAEGVEEGEVPDSVDLHWQLDYKPDWDGNDPSGKKQRELFLVVVQKVGKDSKEVRLSNFKLYIRSYKQAFPRKLVFPSSHPLSHTEHFYL
jgi:hypothetical protein